MSLAHDLGYTVSRSARRRGEKRTDSDRAVTVLNGRSFANVTQIQQDRRSGHNPEGTHSPEGTQNQDRGLVYLFFAYFCYLLLAFFTFWLVFVVSPELETWETWARAWLVRRETWAQYRARLLEEWFGCFFTV